MNTFVQFVATLVIPSFYALSCWGLLIACMLHPWLAKPAAVVIWAFLFMLGHQLTGHLADDRKRGREVSIGEGLSFLVKLFLYYLGIIAACLFADTLTLVLAERALAKPFWARTVWEWNRVILRPLFGPLPDALGLFMTVVVGYVVLSLVLPHAPTIAATGRHLQGRQGILTSHEARRRLRR